MCLWHPVLIPFMPDKTLKRLFRTCCELRQNWRGESSTKQAPFFVRNGLYEQLIAYQQIVTREMLKRGLDWCAFCERIGWPSTLRKKAHTPIWMKSTSAIKFYGLETMEKAPLKS